MGVLGLAGLASDLANNTIRRVLQWALVLSAGFLIVLGTLVVFAFDPCNGVAQDSIFWEQCQNLPAPRL